MNVPTGYQPFKCHLFGPLSLASGAFSPSECLVRTLYNVCSVHWGDTMSSLGDIMSTSEGYHEYIGGVQYIGGYHGYIGDIMSTSGDTMSTSGMS